MNTAINLREVINNFLPKLKKPLVWLIVTLLLYILLATVVMFSRQTTLHGVRAFDFDIFSKSITLFEKNTVKKDFKNIADTLTIRDGKTVFFPVALLDKSSCTENAGKIDSSLCKQFNNADIFKLATNDIKPRKRYGKYIYDMPNGKSYLYKSIDDNSILIGEAGKYLIKSNFDAFIMFMKDDWARYFNIKDKAGKYGDFDKTWKKTNGIFYIVISISFLLYLLYLWHFWSKSKEYANLKKKSMRTDHKLYTLNQEFNNLARQKKTIENNIAELSRNNDTISNSEETKKKLAEYVENEERLKDLISRKKEEIISTEHIDSNIIDDIKLKSEKISSTNMAKEIERLIEKLHDIKRLWQRELTWTERKELESNITGYETKIPFTISQSVILFEKEIVLKKAKMCKGYEEEMNLFEMIELISKDETKEIKGILHKIRKARNDWSHKGIVPNKEVLNDLLRLLNHFKVEPAF